MPQQTVHASRGHPSPIKQLDSTSGIRLQSILRAITGNLDVVGGEVLNALNPNFRTEAELQLHDTISPEQRAKQLGYNTHPVFTYRTAEMLQTHLERVYGQRWVDQVMGCHMANPTEVFRAMADGTPYPIKGFFALGNNALSYPNQDQIHRALLNQELIVVHEIFMTPTALLADYVLSGDVFTERNHIADGWAWNNRLSLSEQVVDPPAEASSTFRFWTDLGRRFGFEDHFGWDTIEEVLDYRLEPSGRTWAEFQSSVVMEIPTPQFRSYRSTGFATLSGKVELRSSILENLGFDPLPYYREKPQPRAKFPYLVFSGVREDPFFQTGQRNIGVLRRRSPAPKLFLHPDDASRDDLTDGQWARLETPHGQVVAKIELQKGMRPGHLRVPHGWWFPETRGEVDLAGAFVASDAVLTADNDDVVDHEQGVPHFKGYPGRLVACDAPTGMGRTTLEG